MYPCSKALKIKIVLEERGERIGVMLKYSLAWPKLRFDGSTTCWRESCVGWMDWRLRKGDTNVDVALVTHRVNL